MCLSNECLTIKYSVNDTSFCPILSLSNKYCLWSLPHPHLSYSNLTVTPRIDWGFFIMVTFNLLLLQIKGKHRKMLESCYDGKICLNICYQRAALCVKFWWKPFHTYSTGLTEVPKTVRQKVSGHDQWIMELQKRVTGFCRWVINSPRVKEKDLFALFSTSFREWPAQAQYLK